MRFNLTIRAELITESLDEAFEIVDVLRSAAAHKFSERIETFGSLTTDLEPADRSAKRAFRAEDLGPGVGSALSFAFVERAGLSQSGDEPSISTDDDKTD